MKASADRGGMMRPLRCPNCAAPLHLPAGGDVAKCEYCGTETRFFRTVAGHAPPQDPRGRYRPGQAVLVEWGDAWWPARILRCLPNGHYEVHYDGWSSQWDEVVDSKRIALPGEVPAPAPKARAGRSAGCAFAAAALTIIGMAIGFFCSENERTSSPADGGTADTATVPPPVAAAETVMRDVGIVADGAGEGEASADADAGEPQLDAGPPGRPLEPRATLRPGDAVWAFSEKKWYRAEIVRRVRSDRFLVHFVGYDERYDETVPTERLRLRDDNVPPPGSEATAPGRPAGAGGTFAEGDAVWAYSEGDWHRAEIVRRKGGGRYLVRFIGYAERFDETLDAISLRLRDD